VCFGLDMFDGLGPADGRDSGQSAARLGRGASCTLGRSGGANGWYTTPVTLSVSATDIATGVAETRCALDAASATFAAFPSACAAPVAAGPAYDFPLGTNTAGPVTASDEAANATTKSTTFTVKVTPTSLCTLT
jgi:hypothetical protein